MKRFLLNALCNGNKGKDDKEIVGCLGTLFMLTTVESDMVLLAQPPPVLFYGNVQMFQNELVSVMSFASTINPRQTTHTKVSF